MGSITDYDMESDNGTYFDDIDEDTKDLINDWVRVVSALKTGEVISSKKVPHNDDSNDNSSTSKHMDYDTYRKQELEQELVRELEEIKEKLRVK